MAAFFAFTCAAYDDTPDADYIKDLRSRAESGDSDAQYELGTLYQEGDGLRQSDSEAVKWFRKSASQGDSNGQTSLGFAYRGGFGVPHDLILAYMWFDLAARQGNEGALSLRSSTAELMTYDQILEARKLSWRWKPTASQ